MIDAERVEQLEAALLALLPGLELDLRYARPDEDREALISRVQTVREALALPSDPPAATSAPLSRRDEFAKAALVGLLASPVRYSAGDAVRDAWMAADMMLEQGDKPPQKVA